MGSLDALNMQYSNYSDIYSNTTANSLENTLNNTNLSGASEDELMEVCKDFEEYFVEQVVKSMIKMTNVTGDSDENNYSALFGLSSSDDSYMNSLSSYYGDQLVTTISQAICDDESGQGIGLAKTLYEQMKRNYGITSEGDTN